MVVSDRFVFKNKKDITHNALVSALSDEARLKALTQGKRISAFNPNYWSA